MRREDIKSISIKDIRKFTGLVQADFCEYYEIPLSTLKKWEADPASKNYHECPIYVKNMLYRVVMMDFGERRKTMLTFDEQMKIASVRSEQAKYKNKMSFDEATAMQKAHMKEIQMDPLTLDEINQYIKEARDAV